MVRRVTKRKVTKRKVTKRRKKKQSLKAQLGGGEKHYCLYSTLDSEGNHVDGCPNYYFEPTSWYNRESHRGWWRTRKDGKPDKKIPTRAGVSYELMRGVYICPSHYEKFRKKTTSKGDVSFADMTIGDIETKVTECKSPKIYSNMQGIGKGMGENYKETIYNRYKDNSKLLVKEKICTSKKPYLTDKGQCCSATPEVDKGSKRKKRKKRTMKKKGRGKKGKSKGKK